MRYIDRENLQKDLNRKIGEKQPGLIIDNKDNAQIVMDMAMEELLSRPDKVKELEESVVVDISKETERQSTFIIYIGNFAQTHGSIMDIEGTRILSIDGFSVNSVNLSLKMGIGTILMKRLIAEARQQGCVEASLKAYPISFPGLGDLETMEWYKKEKFHPYIFYEKFGFEPVDKKMLEKIKKSMTENDDWLTMSVIMEKDLTRK